MLYTFFNYNFIQLPFQILAAEFIFLYGIPKRKKFGIKMTLGIVILFALSWLWWMVTGHMVNSSLVPYVLLYLGYAALSILLLLFCFDIGFLEVLFIMAGGYAVQHMIFTLSKIFLYLLRFHYDPARGTQICTNKNNSLNTGLTVAE